MTANVPETTAQWMPLEDGLEPRVSRRSRLLHFASVSLVLLGLFGLAAIVVFMPNSQQSDPDALMLIEHTPLPKDGTKATEMRTSSLQIVQATSIYTFNELLQSTILVDAQAVYDAIPPNQFEVLFQDFLGKMGSVAPKVSSTTDRPKNQYPSQHEYQRRFDIFKNNILEVLRLNADEYARNADIRRARFGITVHADWTKEEFRTTRLNLKATNLSQVQSLISKPVAKKTVQNSSSNLKPMDLAETCHIMTGGTCSVFPCHASRGSVCYEGSCICTDGACAASDGTCVRPGNCKVSTGESCRFMGCASRRHAQCVHGACVCPPGNCAVGGVCVPSSSSPNTAPKCSKHFSGPVRDQGTCGDCWAFSTAQQLRYMTFNKYKKDPGLMSVQYLVDCMPEEAHKRCSEGVKGCCGGLPIRADQWLQRSGGLPTAAAYGPLESDKHPFAAYRCKSYVQKKVVPRGMERHTSEKDIAEALCKTGPVSIAIAADPLQHYIGGVMNVKRCPANQIDHAVLYTGFDQTFNNGEPVHIILNSWGPNWGVPTQRPYRHIPGANNGHVLFKYGDNTCNIEALATNPQDVELL